MKGVFYSVSSQIHGDAGDSGEDFGAPPRNDATGFSIHRVRYCSASPGPVRFVPSNAIYRSDAEGFLCAAHVFSPPLSAALHLTPLFSIISHTSLR